MEFHSTSLARPVQRRTLGNVSFGLRCQCKLCNPTTWADASPRRLFLSCIMHKRSCCPANVAKDHVETKSAMKARCRLIPLPVALRLANGGLGPAPDEVAVMHAVGELRWSTITRHVKSRHLPQAGNIPGFLHLGPELDGPDGIIPTLAPRQPHKKARRIRRTHILVKAACRAPLRQASEA